MNAHSDTATATRARSRRLAWWRPGLALAAVLAVLAGTGVTLYRHAEDTVTQTLTTQMGLVAGNMAGSIGFMLQAYRADAAWLARLPELRHVDAQRTTEFLTRERTKWPHLHLVARIDREGRLRYVFPLDVLPGALGKDFSYRDYFRGARDSGRAVVSGTIVAGGENNQDVGKRFKAFVTAAPVVDEQGRFDGVVVSAIATESVGKEMVLPVQAGRAYAWLLDEDLRFLSHPDADKRGQLLTEVDELPAELLQRVTSGQSGSGQYQQAQTGAHKLMAFASVNIDGHRWPVAVTLPVAEVTAMVRPLALHLIWLMLAAFASLAGGAWWIWRKQEEVGHLRERLHTLEIRIDQEKKEAELSTITESAYFQQLLGKLDELRAEAHQP